MTDRDFAVLRVAALVNAGHLIEAKAKLDLLMEDPDEETQRLIVVVRVLYLRIANGGELPRDFSYDAVRKDKPATPKKLTRSKKDLR